MLGDATTSDAAKMKGRHGRNKEVQDKMEGRQDTAVSHFRQSQSQSVLFLQPSNETLCPWSSNLQASFSQRQLTGMFVLLRLVLNPKGAGIRRPHTKSAANLTLTPVI